MFGMIFNLIRQRFRHSVDSAARKAAFGLIALAFVFLGAAGLLLSLFLALEPSMGALRAALSVSGVAFVLALLAAAPFWWPRRRPPPPDPTIAQLVALTSLTSAGLSARQLALGGALLALVIGVAAARSPPKS